VGSTVRAWTLIANGTIGDGAGTPFWVIVVCAVAISLGTYLGGWRVIRTLGKGLVDISPPQGYAAESASATVILAASHFGFPLSTTHVCTGSVIGSGVGRRLAEVRWSVATRMVLAWLVTLPAAALVGALAWKGADLIGGAAGASVVFLVGAGLAVGLYVASRRAPVHAGNVNDEWTATKVGAK